MPIFEYQCKKCSSHFEELVFSEEEAVVCPSCGSKKVEKELSTFGVNMGVDTPCGMPEPPAGCGEGSCSCCMN